MTGEKSALEGLHVGLSSMMADGTLEDANSAKVKARWKREDAREKARFKQAIINIIVAARNPSANTNVTRLVKREISRAEFQG